MSPRPAAARGARWTWLDLRLVPFALVLWGCRARAPWLDPGALLVAGLLAAAVGAALIRRPHPGGRRCWSGCWRGSPSLGRRGRPRPGAGGVTTAAGRRRGPHGHGGPRAGQRSTARRPGPGRVVADATVTEVVVGARRHRVDDDVLLFAPAEGWAELLPGQRVRARVGAAMPRDGDPLVAVLAARGPPTPLGGPGPVQQAAGAMRDGLAASAGRVLEPRPAGLLPGLTVGDTRAMDPVLTEEFRRAGPGATSPPCPAPTSRSSSPACCWPLRRRAADRRIQAVVAGLGLVGLRRAGPPEPERRPRRGDGGGRAAGAGHGPVAGGRPRAGAAAVRPAAARSRAGRRSPGFALSVVATAAIVLLAPGWSRRLRTRGCWPVLADALAVSAAAGLATAPLVAALDGTVSLVSLPANLLAAPAVAPATVLGLAAAVVAPVWPAAADVLVWVAGWPTDWLVGVAEHGGRAARRGDCRGRPGPAVPCCSPRSWWQRARCCGGVPDCGRSRSPRWSASWSLGWPLRQSVRGWPPPETVAVVCDVGQGDAIALPTGPGPRSSSTPALTSGRSTGAWTGWGSPRCPSSSSPIWTPTTRPACGERWRAGTSAWWRPGPSRRRTTGCPRSRPWWTGPAPSGSRSCPATVGRSGRRRSRSSGRIRAGPRPRRPPTICRWSSA